MIYNSSIILYPFNIKNVFFVKLILIITKQYLFSQTDEQKCWFVRNITIKLHTHLYIYTSKRSISSSLHFFTKMFFSSLHTLGPRINGGS